MSSEKKIMDMLIEQSEGVKLRAFEDSDGLMCIGINLVKFYPHGALIREHDTCTEAKAYEWTNAKLHKDVYPDVYEFCRRHNVPKEIYESLCVFCFNEGTKLIKTIPFMVSIVNAKWFHLSRMMLGKFDYTELPFPINYSPNKLRKRRIEINNFKHLIEPHFLTDFMKDMEE